MNPYSQIASTLAALRTDSGGTQEQRAATAGLTLALFHVHFVQMASELRRQDFQVTVAENGAQVWISVEGASVIVARYGGQTEVRVDFTGFDFKVVPLEHRTQHLAMSRQSIEAVEHIVEESVKAIGVLLRQELAVRARQRVGAR